MAAAIGEGGCPTLPRLSHLPARRELERQGIEYEVIAERLGISVRTTWGYFKKPLRWGQADRVAAALNVHPNCLWGDEWWAVQRTYDEAMEARARTRSLRGWEQVERSWRQWWEQQDRRAA